jgi:hypothetical protein
MRGLLEDRGRESREGHHKPRKEPGCSTSNERQRKECYLKEKGEGEWVNDVASGEKAGHGALKREA